MISIWGKLLGSLDKYQSNQGQQQMTKEQLSKYLEMIHGKNGENLRQATDIDFKATQNISPIINKE